MKKTDNPEWYDRAYSESLKSRGEYSLHPSSSVYILSWERVLEWIGTKDKMADFGCGVGQFAELAISKGKKYVQGIDWSSVAIDAARERNPKHAIAFEVSDIMNPESFSGDYDVAVFLEVLEHIEKDVEILSLVPPGKRVIFSVPSFGYKSHYRCFDDIESVLERYKDIIEIMDTDVVVKGSKNNKLLFLVYGKRN